MIPVGFCQCGCGRWGLIDLSNLRDFWLFVDRTPGCWLWRGQTMNKGYGLFHVPQHSLMLAHRLAWILDRGRIPYLLRVLHHCDVRPCVRPDHLFVGSQTDNMRDASLKGRFKHLTASVAL